MRLGDGCVLVRCLRQCELRIQITFVARIDFCFIFCCLVVVKVVRLPDTTSRKAFDVSKQSLTRN